MIGFVVLACHISFSSMKLECEWNVKETFTSNEACNIYESNYTLKSGEQLGICDVLDLDVKKGDKRPVLTLKK